MQVEFGAKNTTHFSELNLFNDLTAIQVETMILQMRHK